jgi:hypothetical protein
MKEDRGTSDSPVTQDFKSTTIRVNIVETLMEEHEMKNQVVRVIGCWHADGLAACRPTAPRRPKRPCGAEHG